MAFSNTALLKTPTMLEQLLEEINFQRTKEMRQLLKDDSGFVMLQGTTYWTDLFVRHFLFQNEQTIDCDDLLFFVRKKHVKGTSRYLPKFETEVDVFRKDSRKLPIGDPDIDWEETVYLNLIIHQFDYTLTLAICTRTSPKELQVLKRHSQKVYASPSRRRMDTKGELEEMTYPHICFMVDNFDEVFCDILVRDGEMVCVELVASDRAGAIQGVIFLGSIRYDALKKVYDARQSSLSSKMAQRMTFGLFSGSSTQRCEFVRMKGPQGKGHAEMAVTKPKGSGVETPTSEPGFCATDMWDSDWDEDPEDFYVYRSQRRLSDPSANLNNFVRGGWKTKLDVTGAKSRSENEGLDAMENGVSEIEAGDVRDVYGTCPASSRCCGCFKSSSCKRDSLSLMSEIYCRSAPAAVNGDPRSPTGPQEKDKYPSSHHLNSTSGQSKRCSSHLNNMLNHADRDIDEAAAKHNHQHSKCTSKASNGSLGSQQCKCCPRHFNNLLNQSEIEIHSSKKSSRALRSPLSSKCTPHHLNNLLNQSEYEMQDGASKNRHLQNKCSMRAPIGPLGAQQCKCSTTHYLNNILNQSEYELADDAVKVDDRKNRSHVILENANFNDEFEFADDAISLNGEISDERPNSRASLTSLKSLKSNEKPNFINVNGKEELPSPEQIKNCSPENNINKEISRISSKKTEESNNSNNKVETSINKVEIKIKSEPNDFDGNCNRLSVPQAKHFSTLPKRKRSSVNHRMWYRPLLEPPHRVTPDGTDIYYWCDMPKRTEHELDDGAYNPLWTMRGFTQTFHFWKENKRAQSVPLNAFLTYITLPWWSIAKDILDHREGPILTF